MTLPRMAAPLRHLLFAIAIALAAVALYQLAARVPLRWDVTQNGLNSLSPGSIAALRQLHGEVNLTVFLRPQNAEQGDMRKLIREFVALYQRYKPDIELEFVDPAQQPERTRQAAIRHEGEMVVAYAGRTEHLSMLNEQALSSALLALAHRKDDLLLFLDGHGERRLDGIANHDLGEFGQKLKQNGYHFAPLNLTLAQEVPENARLLLLTHPQVALLPGETQKLLRHIERGGNLLWLLDAEPLRGLEALAETLGLQLPPGKVIDPAAREMGASADWTLASGYPAHAATRDFNLLSVFPEARPLALEERDGWHAATLVEGAPRGWVSRQPAGSHPSFDTRRDMRGPVMLAVALERDTGDKLQRIVIVGSGAFLANTYAGNGGNLDLGVNLVNWLANEEALVGVQPRNNRDEKVTLSKNQLTVISIGLVIVLPVLLIGIGALQWWRMRH